MSVDLHDPKQVEQLVQETYLAQLHERIPGSDITLELNEETKLYELKQTFTKVYALCVPRLTPHNLESAVKTFSDNAQWFAEQSRKEAEKSAQEVA